MRRAWAMFGLRHAGIPRRDVRGWATAAPPDRAGGRPGARSRHKRQRWEEIAMTQITMAKALNSGLRAAMEADPKVLVMGEDVGKLGGVFRITDGLQKDFGEQRVLDTPLAESGIIGTAVGL